MDEILNEQPPPRTLILFSDYACPLSYLGKVAMDRYAKWAIFPVDTEYRLFDLYNYIRSPDGDLDRTLDLAHEDYFLEVQESANILNNQLDLVSELQSPGIVDSYLAHKAAYYVKKEHSKEEFERYHDAIFEARWQEGRDISQKDVLKSIGTSVGLPPSEIHDATNDPDLENEIATILKKRQRTRRPISPITVYQELSLYGVIPFQTVSQLVESGQGHPGDEMGVQWFRYRDYFDV